MSARADRLILCRACGRPIAVERDEPPTIDEMIDDLLAGGYLRCECGHITHLPLAYEDA